MTVNKTPHAHTLKDPKHWTNIAGVNLNGSGEVRSCENTHAGERVKRVGLMILLKKQHTQTQTIQSAVGCPLT